MSQYSVSPVALNAPGLPFSPVIQEDPEFVALLTAFGLAGQAASQVGQMGAQQRRDREELDSRIADVDRAVWSRAAGQDLATFRLGIDNGTVKLPPGADPGQFAEHLVGSHLDRMGRVSDAGREAYMQAAPRVADALARQASIDTAKDKNDLADALSNQAFLSDDPAAAVQSAINAGFDEVTAHAKVIVPALKTAAQLGDAAKFESLAATLPEGQFTQDVMVYRRNLMAVQADQAAKQQDAIDSMFQAMENDNAPSWQMRHLLEEAKPRMTPANYNRNLNRIERVEKGREQESVALGLDAAYGAVRRGGTLEEGEKIIEAMGLGEQETVKAQNQLRSAFSELMREQQAVAEANAKKSATLDSLMQVRSGVPLATIEDSTVKVGDKTINVSAKEQAEAITEIEMAAMAKGRTPEQAVAAQANWLSTNGVEYPRWKSLVHAAYTSSGSLETADSVPPATVEALNLYNQVRSTDPGLAQSMFPEPERRYFDTAINWLGDTAVGGKPDYLGALRHAHRAVHPSPHEVARVSASIDDASVIAAAKEVVGANGVFFGPDYEDIGNRSELEAAIKTDAIRYAPGNTKEAALKLAIDNAKVSGADINGFWTYTAVPGLPAQVRHEMPALGMKAIDDYYAANKPAGIDKADLGIVFNRATNRWIIQDRLDRQAPGPASQTTLTNQKLIEMYQQAEATKFEKVKSDTTAAAAKRRANPYGLSNAIETKPTKPGIVTGGSE